MKYVLALVYEQKTVIFLLWKGIFQKMIGKPGLKLVQCPTCMTLLLVGYIDKCDRATQIDIIGKHYNNWKPEAITV